MRATGCCTGRWWRPTAGASVRASAALRLLDLLFAGDFDPTLRAGLPAALRARRWTGDPARCCARAAQADRGSGPDGAGRVLQRRAVRRDGVRGGAAPLGPHDSAGRTARRRRRRAPRGVPGHDARALRPHDRAVRVARRAALQPLADRAGRAGARPTARFPPCRRSCSRARTICALRSSPRAGSRRGSRAPTLVIGAGRGPLRAERVSAAAAAVRAARRLLRRAGPVRPCPPRRRTFPPRARPPALADAGRAASRISAGVRGRTVTGGRR